MLKALVPIANGTEEMEAVIIIDMLRRAKIDVLTAGLTEIAHCSHDVKIVPDKNIYNVSPSIKFDIIVLPGGIYGCDEFAGNKKLKKLLTIQADEKRWIGAICAAPSVLKKFDILTVGQKITCHPSIKDEMNEYEYSEENVVVFENIISSRGAGAAFDFALKIIELLAGKDKADEIVRSICYGVK
jgi:DJ-1 family protein